MADATEAADIKLSDKPAAESEAPAEAEAKPQALPRCPHCRQPILNMNVQLRQLPGGAPGLVLFCGNENCLAFLQMMQVNMPQPKVVPAGVMPGFNPTRRH